MPRTGRGGARAGTPGKKYPNRTDLPGKVLPVKAAPGQTYGKAGAQENAQRAVPMRSGPPMAAPSAGPSPTGPGGGPPPPPDLPADVPPPGSLPPLDAPTDRPGEPVTAGAASGPGPGLDVLGPSPDELDRQGDVSALAPYLGEYERIANLPNATPSMRQFVRRLKSLS